MPVLIPWFNVLHKLGNLVKSGMEVMRPIVGNRDDTGLYAVSAKTAQPIGLLNQQHVLASV